MHLPFNGISGLIVGVKTADRYETLHLHPPHTHTPHNLQSAQGPKTARGDLNAATAAPTLNTGPVANWTRSTDHSKHRNVASQFQWKKKKKKEKKQKFSFSVFFSSVAVPTDHWPVLISLAQIDSHAPADFYFTLIIRIPLTFLLLFFFFWLENRYSSDTGRSFSMSDLVSIFKMYFIF